MRKSSLMIMSLTLVILLGVTLSNANLLLNSGFEMGDFTNWIQSGNPSFTYVSENLPQAGNYSHSGEYYANLGPIYSFGFLAQEFPVVSGTTYDITFWLANLGSEPTIKFEAYWSGAQGTKLLGLSDPGAFPYTQYSFSVTAAYTGSSSIFFAFRNDPSYFGLDDVSVTASTAPAVPEPATMLLLGSGLIGLAGYGERKFFRK